MESQNISDIIENYLKQILAETEQIEIRRSEIADRFHVVPSQINYVIKTRFTIQNGYVVESKRGGGGYIRIEKVQLLDNLEYLDTLVEAIGDSISQRDAIAVIQSLYDADVVSKEEGSILISAIDKETLSFSSLALENEVRAKILVGVIHHLCYKK